MSQQQNLIFLKRFVLYNRLMRSSSNANAPKIIVNSIGKSGTHLLMKALELMPGINRFPIHIGRQRLGLLLWCWLWCPKICKVMLWLYQAHTQTIPTQQSSDGIFIDTDSPFILSSSKMGKILDLVEPGWFAMGHFPYSEKLNDLLKAKNFKMLLIFRDPRDVVISHAKYLAGKSTHYMYSYYKNLPESERIVVSIKGVSNDVYPQKLMGIRQRLENTMPWIETPYTYTTYFEKLIGPKGGGTAIAQQDELQAITAHLDLPIDSTELNSIASQLFGGTRTFRKGSVGRWQKEFSKTQKDLFKKDVGDLLVKLGYEQNLGW